MAEEKPRFDGFYPARAPIDAYGNGGFRFAGMSHKGSLLCLPDGIRRWDVADAAGLTLDALAALIPLMPAPHVLLLGTGPRQIFPSPEMRTAFADARIGLEAMDTGAAAPHLQCPARRGPPRLRRPHRRSVTRSPPHHGRDSHHLSPDTAARPRY